MLNSHAAALWKDESGVILSAELVLILTIGVLAMIVGLNSVAKAVTQELNDVSGALGALDQSYAYRGMNKWWHAGVAGSAYADRGDACDCSGIMMPSSAVKSGPGSLECASTPSAVPRPAVPAVPPAATPYVPHGPVIPSAPCNNCEETPLPLHPVPEEGRSAEPEETPATPDSDGNNQPKKKSTPPKSLEIPSTPQDAPATPSAEATVPAAAGPQLTSGFGF